MSADGGQRVSRRQKAAFQMHRQDVVEVSIGHLQQQLVPRESRRVDYDVHRSNALEQLRDLGRRPRIAAHERDREPLRAKVFMSPPRRRLVVRVGDDHLDAIACQRARDGEAETAAATGDEGVSHRCGAGRHDGV
jgi:hypothetical protein